MNKHDLLEVGYANKDKSYAVDQGIRRYNEASTNVTTYSTQLQQMARMAQDRIFVPHYTPTLDNKDLVMIASKLATAETMAWNALADLACALQHLGVEVEW